MGGLAVQWSTNDYCNLLVRSIKRFRWLGLLFLICSWLCLTSGQIWAQTGVLVVQVKDGQGHPIRGVPIGIEGGAGSAITGDDGTARIQLAQQTNEQRWVSLQSQPGQGLFVQPWDSKILVPSSNPVEVVVVKRGDRAALESGAVISALTAQINQANAPKAADKHASQEDPKTNLAAIAEQYGLAPEDLDQAIRAWGAKATDPYDAGLAALYGRNYSNASAQLANSLQKREQAVATDQKAVADAAFFLGQSQYQEGKYRESATAYQRCLQLRPDDPVVLYDLALSSEDAGDYGEAERLYGQLLAMDEKALGSDRPEVATRLNNLASSLQAKGDYAGAEPLYRRALAIDEKALGPDDPKVGTDLNNLAGLLYNKGNYTEAEPLYRRALAIDEKALGPDRPRVATELNNLASLLKAKSDYDGAEPL